VRGESMKRAVCALLLFGLGSASATAQTPVRLTLPDAIARGIEASHRLAELGARQDAAKAVEDQRKAADAPQMALLSGYTRTNHVDAFRINGGFPIYPDVPDNFRSRFDVQWPIYTGGRTDALTRAAEAESNALSQDREAARADLRLEIAREYWAVLTARASVDVVTQALALIGAHLADVRNLLAVGLVPPSDVLTTEAQQAREQQFLIEAENLRETTSLDFRRLVGLAPDEPFELVDRIDTPPAPSPPTAALADMAKANRPERKAIEIRLEGLGERATAAGAGRLPQIATVGGYDFARPNPKIFPRQDAWKPSWDVGVNVSWSVFDGGRVRAEVAEASANQKAAEERLKDFDVNVSVEVRQRAADVASARAAIAASEVGVRSATEARRVIDERYSAGVATNTEVLDAEVALLQADLDRTRALANVKLAEARLDRALGR
jgi:outer membrane protein